MPIVSLATNETDVAAMTSGRGRGPHHRRALLRHARLRTEPALRAGVPVALWRRQPHHRRRGGRLLPRTWRPTPRAARGFATPDLVAALKGAQFEAPQGRVAIDGDTQHTSLWPRIARVNARREFEIIYAARAAVRPVPYLVDHALDPETLALP